MRADADALGVGVHLLYTGDFNADSSNEPAMQTLLSAGNGQVFDPINRLGQWYNQSAMRDIMTEAPAVTAPPGLIGGGLKNRFDLLWQSAAVIGDFGLQALPSTYHTFGVDGSVALHHSVDDASNTALPELDNRLAVLDALANDTSDHLPVLQEYQIVTAPPLPPQGTAFLIALARLGAPDTRDVHPEIGDSIGLSGARQPVFGVGLTAADLQRRGVSLGQEPTGEAIEKTAGSRGRVGVSYLVEQGGAIALLEPLLEVGAIKAADPVDR